jgi:hypothetical protein
MTPRKVLAHIDLPWEVAMIGSILKMNNPLVEVYAVGGVVRDYLYHGFHSPKEKEWKPKDIDITTNLSEEEIIARLQSPDAQRYGIKIKEKESVDTFGVVFVNVRGKGPYEVAPFRKDVGSIDGRRPERVERAVIEEDAMRRDFTINNLYYDYLHDHILDFNAEGQGVEDIKNKIVRTVGDPFERFQEDKLRILRMVRFFSRYNDGCIVNSTDERTLQAIEHFKNLRQYPGMSGERIMTEFLAGLSQCQNVINYLRNYMDLDLFPAVFPDCKVSLIGASKLRDIKNPKVVLTTILKENSNLCERLNELKYPNTISEDVEFFTNVLTFDPKDAVSVIKAKEKRFIRAKNRPLTDEEIRDNRATDTTLFWDLNELSRSIDDEQRIDIILHLLHFEPYNVPDGKELMAAGLRGKEIGEAQRRAMQEVYENSLRECVEFQNSL